MQKHHQCFSLPARKTKNNVNYFEKNEIFDIKKYEWETRNQPKIRTFNVNSMTSFLNFGFYCHNKILGSIMKKKH